MVESSPRPKYRPGSLMSSTRPKARPLFEGMNYDQYMEYIADEIKDNPIAQLGVDPNIMSVTPRPQGPLSKGFEDYLDKLGSPTMNAFYTYVDENEDYVEIGEDLKKAKPVQAHEFTHRGFRLLKNYYDEDPEFFVDKYGQAAANIVKDIGTREGHRRHEFDTEMYDNREAVFETPSGPMKYSEHTEGDAATIAKFQKYRSLLGPRVEKAQTNKLDRSLFDAFQQLERAAGDMMNKRKGYAGGGTVKSSPRPQYRPEPAKTGQMTVRNRPVWEDPLTKEIYSEKTITIPWGEGYTTVPSIDEKGQELSSEEVFKRILTVKDQLNKGGPVDFITGEELPVFGSEEEAIKYAMWRSNTMFDKKAADQGFQTEQYELDPEPEDNSFLYDMGSYTYNTAKALGALGLRKLGLYAQGGVADQMNSMLPAADNDTRSTNEYLGRSDDEFNPLQFAKESWDSAKERFMDAGITEVDANDPALYNAYLRSVDYLKDTGLAGLDLIDAAARAAIGTLGEIVTGDDQTQKRFERDIYSMPDAFAGMVGTKSISQLDDAIESAVGTGIQAAEKAKDVGYAAYQKSPAVVGDIVGQTKAAFSGDKDFGTTSDVGPRPLSAFGSKGAMDLDVDAFAQARELMKDGVQKINPQNPDQFYELNKKVWKETGWYIDPKDNQWRFEIDDSKSKVTLDNLPVTYKELEDSGGEFKLTDLFQHDEIYKQYPHLKDIKVRFYNPSIAKNSQEKRLDVGGYMDSTSNILAINTSAVDPEKFRTVILHEIQHSIQDYEGLTLGSNSQSIDPNVLSKGEGKILNAIKDLSVDNLSIKINNAKLKVASLDNWFPANLAKDYASSGYTINEINKDLLDRQSNYVSELLKDYPNGIPPELGKEVLANVNKLKGNILKQAGYELGLPKIATEFYLGAGGEIESRVVEFSKNMTDWQRRNTPPGGSKVFTEGSGNYESIEGFPLDRQNQLLEKEGKSNKPGFRGKEGVDPTQSGRRFFDPEVVGSTDVYLDISPTDFRKPKNSSGEFEVDKKGKPKQPPAIEKLNKIFKGEDKLLSVINSKSGSSFKLDGKNYTFNRVGVKLVDKNELQSDLNYFLLRPMATQGEKIFVPVIKATNSLGNPTEISMGKFVEDIEKYIGKSVDEQTTGLFGKIKGKLGFAEGGVTDQTDRMFGRYNAAPTQPQKGMGWGELIVDNILGLDNEYESFGEKLGKTINEDEVKFLKDMAVGAYEGAKEFVTSPIETTKQVALDIKDSVYRLGAEDLNTRLQRMYNISYDQATDEHVNRAREAVLSDALTALELIPAAKGATTAVKAGVKAIPGGVKADVIGQTKAMLSGDKEFLRGTPTERARTQSLSAGFTGDNPPTYLPKNELPFDPDKIYETKDGIIKFREPIAEFTRRLTMANSFPSKGMTGAEFLRLLEKNAESIPPSSYKEGLVDRDKRYSREELLDVVTKGPAGLPESIYYNIADLTTVPRYGDYQRQSQVGYVGYPRHPENTSYFAIPILSRTSGNTFKANSQHFSPSTTAHVRGSFIDPLVGWNVTDSLSPEFKNIVGKDKPYLLVEEIQSDLLQKGYRKPTNSFDQAWGATTREFDSQNGNITYEEVYGPIDSEISKIVKELDEEDLKYPRSEDYQGLDYRTYDLKYDAQANGDFLRSGAERGFVTFDLLAKRIKADGRLSDWWEYYSGNLSTNNINLVTDEMSGKVYTANDLRNTAKNINAYEDFEKYLAEYDPELSYEFVLHKYEDDLDKYAETVKNKIDKYGLNSEVKVEDLAFMYKNFKELKATVDKANETIALPPVRKNRQTVEEALKLLIAKADQEGVDKIVIPPASKIAEARNRTIDPSDKGDRFYRTYVTDLNKALEDLEKNYPVTIYRDIDLPYTDRPTRTAAEQHLIDMGFEDMVDNNPGQAAANAIDDAGINDDDLFTVEEGNQFFNLPEGFFDDVTTQEPKTKINTNNYKGTIIDISKLREQFQVDKPRQFAEGGAVGNMNRQMELFALGGLNDDGMDRDPVSGNEVPAGSMANEVRDDIPAQLSEGEYVVPADVVRYYGVKFFEDLREEAKIGLTEMETNGRIGGEPIMEDDGSITQEDLAALDQMISTGAYNGGLMDKLITAAKTDRIINQRLNRGGVVVGFAGGGAVQSPYNDPTAIDQVINKVMAAAQANPQILDELAKRGIQVSRTQPQMQPEEMQQVNPPEGVVQGYATGNVVTPFPSIPTIGTEKDMAKNTSYSTGITGIPDIYTVPGASYTYAGAATPTTVETPSKEFCEAKGMMYDAVTQTCVPKPAEAPKDSGDSDPGFITPTEPATPWFEGVNWADPEAIMKFGTGSLSPIDGWKEKGMQAAGLMLGGPLGLVAAAAPKVDALMDLSSARAAYLVAMAKGDKVTAEALGNQITAYEKNAGFLVKKFGNLVASGKGKFNSFTKDLGLDPDQFDPDNIDKWTDEQRTAYNNAIEQKYKKPTEQPKPRQQGGSYGGSDGGSDGGNNDPVVPSGNNQGGGYKVVTDSSGNQTKVPVAGDTASRGGGFTDTRPDDPRGEGRYGGSTTAQAGTGAISNPNEVTGLNKGGLMRRRKY